MYKEAEWLVKRQASSEIVCTLIWMCCSRRWSSQMVPGFAEKDVWRQMVFVSHFLLLMQQILVLKQIIFRYFTVFLKYTFLFCGLFLHKYPWILYMYNLLQKYYMGKYRKLIVLPTVNCFYIHKIVINNEFIEKSTAGNFEGLLSIVLEWLTLHM